MALIQAGLEILANQGIQKLSLRKVAKSAGVSEAAPYRHFKHKESLLAAIAEQGFIQLAERLQDIEEAFAEDARTLFHRSCRTYIDFAKEHPDSMRIMFSFRQSDVATEYPDLQEAADEAFSYLIDMVEYCQQEGWARSGHPLPLALATWSSIHGISMLLIDGCISPDLFKKTTEEAMIDNTITMTLAALQTAPQYE